MPAQLHASFTVFNRSWTLELHRSAIVRGKYAEVDVELDARGNIRNWTKKETAGRGRRQDDAAARSPRHNGLDCYYFGTVAGMGQSSVALTACRLPTVVHAVVFLPGNASFELNPVGGEPGHHLACSEHRKRWTLKSWQESCCHMTGDAENHTRLYTFL